MKNYLMYLLILGLLPIMQVTQAQTLDYDEIRSEGGFNSPSLVRVQQIIPAGNPLSIVEKQELILSATLINLRTLDLRGQGIGDPFVINLCRNLTFRRLINIDLSENIAITNVSIQAILDSDVGCVRDLPQVSGRFGIPASAIYVRAKGTGVLPDRPGYTYFDQHRFGFSIWYLHALTGTPTCDPVIEGGVKFVEVTL